MWWSVWFGRSVSVVFRLVRLFWLDLVVAIVSMFGVLCSAVSGDGLHRGAMFGGVRCTVLSGVMLDKVRCGCHVFECVRSIIVGDVFML